MMQLPARVTASEAKTLLAQLSADMRQAQGERVLDVSQLQQLDSSCVALLLALKRRAQAAGGSLQVVGVTAPLQALVRAYGLAELFDASHTAADAQA